ncbi:STAS domain-containing protein [Chungangia koreensis]|uniref:STAS domain-containing protein n=1 Tax=Chungangia koreensis TaxID=752657 RepID=A0ABV8X524_9LACT
MEFVLQNTELKSYLDSHKYDFEEMLLNQAVTVRDKIDEILRIGDIDLINNAHKLVSYVIDGKSEELKKFARQEGIAWATHSLTLSFKLEWVQAIRRTLWRYVEMYNEYKGSNNFENFFHVEKQINNGIDQFLNAFFINYSTYKDSLLLAQRQLVENLSVPIIPITQATAILPLIGSIDSFRAQILEEKVLTEISRLQIQTLIMDLSGIAEIEDDIADHLTRIINGTTLMGCKTVITGLRAEVVRKIVNLGIVFDPGTATLGSLQQALNKYI